MEEQFRPKERVGGSTPSRGTFPPPAVLVGPVVSGPCFSQRAVKLGGAFSNNFCTSWSATTFFAGFFAAYHCNNSAKLIKKVHGLSRPAATVMTHCLEQALPGAEFRGRTLARDTVKVGEAYIPLHWSCARSHPSDASPYLIVPAEHWCRECQAPPWNCDEWAGENPFFAQVWTNAARVV